MLISEESEELVTFGDLGQLLRRKTNDENE